MRTVGQILKEEREINLYTLEDVEKATKIRKEMLAALENDDYSKLPPQTFVQGFIKNYARFLKLDGEKLLAIFRREFSAKHEKNEVMEAFSNPPKSRKVRITPARVLGLSVTLVVFAFFAYLWIQYHQLVGAPNLKVNNPQDQQVVETPSVLVEGKTDPEVRVAVNNQEVTVSDQGEFRQEVQLLAPVNKISVVATSKLGQKITIDRTVYVKR